MTRPMHMGTFQGSFIFAVWCLVLSLLVAVLVFPARIAAQDTPKNSKPVSGPGSRNARPVGGPTILLRSDADCRVTFDDGPSQFLAAGVTRKVRTALGEHLVIAVSLDGKDDWKTVVQIEKPIQKVVLIELSKARTQRENGEVEATRLQEEVAAKEQQAQKLRQSRQELGAKQEEMKRHRAEIQEKIGTLQIEAQDEESKAAKDDAAAEELKQNGYRAASAGGNLNNTVAILSVSKANEFYQSAQRRREHAKQLRQEIVHLQSQLQTLGANDQ
jgi:hypothetical protein